jgi:Beta/Gamma crystallin
MGLWLYLLQKNTRLIMMPQSLILEEMMLKAYRPPPATDGGPHFVFDGNVLTHRQFQYFLINTREPVIVAGSAVDERNLVYLFDSRDAFEAWSQRTVYADSFARADELVRLYRYQNYSEGSDLGVTVLSNDPLDMDKSNPSQHLMIDKSGWSSKAHLYEGTGFSGRVVSLGVSAIADLNEFEFADTVCSVRASGVLMLSDQVSFNGYRFYITGSPHIAVRDLQRWGFNKAARSAIVC